MYGRGYVDRVASLTAPPRHFQDGGTPDAPPGTLSLPEAVAKAFFGPSVCGWTPETRSDLSVSSRLANKLPIGTVVTAFGISPCLPGTSV